MKTVKDYMSMNWTYNIEIAIEEGIPYYIIRVNEFPGVCTDNEDLSEGMQDIKELLAFNIEIRLKNEEEVPCPIDITKCKGKILYRTDPKKHYDIANLARRNHMSLNQTLDKLVDLGLNLSVKQYGRLTQNS